MQGSEELFYSFWALWLVVLTTLLSLGQRGSRGVWASDVSRLGVRRFLGCSVFLFVEGGIPKP